MVRPTRVMYKLANVLTRWREQVGQSDKKLITRESRGQRCHRPHPHLSDVMEKGYNNNVVGRGTTTTNQAEQGAKKPTDNPQLIVGEKVDNKADGGSQTEVGPCAECGRRSMSRVR